jgi:hypothetical protein
MIMPRGADTRLADIAANDASIGIPDSGTQDADIALKVVILKPKPVNPIEQEISVGFIIVECLDISIAFPLDSRQVSVRRQLPKCFSRRVSHRLHRCDNTIADVDAADTTGPALGCDPLVRCCRLV